MILLSFRLNLPMFTVFFIVYPSVFTLSIAKNSVQQQKSHGVDVLQQFIRSQQQIRSDIFSLNIWNLSNFEYLINQYLFTLKRKHFVSD